jgi:sulfoxide reductase heme-binding subunit YedZ
MRRWIKPALKVLIVVAPLVPLAVLGWNYASGGLGVNPVQAITLRTGKTALVLLVLTLAVTPLSRLPALGLLRSWRRPLGLYAFGYAALHFLITIGLDYGFRWDLVRLDLLDKRFILAGFAALLLLLPLAVTSGGGWRRRLGRGRQRLHWLVYPAALLAVTHFAWQVKADLRQPLIFIGVVLILLLWRLPLKRWVARVRKLFGR